MSFAVQEHFSTLAECLAHVTSAYTETVTVNARDRDRAEPVGSVSVPAFLLRGESAQYPTTTATMQRIPADPTLSERARQLMPNLTNYIEADLRDFLGMSQMDSAGFAQHYGLPTELLDLTSDPDVAGFFASGGDVGTRGYMGVFPTRRLAQSSILIDLRNHAKADRPRRQHAFAFFHREHTDIKAGAAVAEMGATWFSFTLTESDKTTFQQQSFLLDGHTDPVAGALQLVIDTMVQRHGKLPDEIALWLSKRITPAPFVTKVLTFGTQGQPEEVELVPAASAGVHFDEALERDRSYRYWSDKFPTRSRHDV